jgi:hypothetical protein
LESKSWLFVSELIRIPLTLLCVLLFSPLSLSFTFGLSLIAILSIFWTFKYFKVNSNQLIVN